jgi:hypothetical protein
MGILCIIAFISSRAGTVSGMYWIHFGERPENFFPAALALFLVPQFIPHRRRQVPCGSAREKGGPTC